MKIPGFHPAETQYVDTPEGLFTASGVWFRTRVDSLTTYAGGVLEREPLAVLLAQAELWLRSPQALTLWLLPLFLYLLDPWQAAVVALVVYVGWRSLGPSFVSRALVRVFRVLDVVLLQAFYYVFMLSVLAAQGRITALWVGLGGFILLRWGLVRWATQPVVRPIHASLYPLPVPDQVLRSLLIRAALALGVSLPDVDLIEQQVRSFIQRTNRSK